MTHVAQAGGSLSCWVNHDIYVRFRQRMAVCNHGLVSRFANWSRADAGVFLMGIAWADQPLTCLRDAVLLFDEDWSSERVTLRAMENCAICESCEHERMPPSAWVEFAGRHGLLVYDGMLALVPDASDDDARIAGRTVDQLHRALGAALDLADLKNGPSMRTIVDELNAKGAHVDRQRIAKHIQAAFAKLDFSRAKVKRT